MTAADRLHSAVQYHIVNSLGWPALRPLQEESIDPVLAGNHALLIAPTAGGKTEAAMFPVLSRMLTEEWSGLSVLYICPIKALLNNLEARLSYLADLVGRRVQLWHGDIPLSEKNRAEKDLPDILLTTPESLEGILISSRRSHLRLLGNIQCVVIDELHAFAGDDRGWHLLALLERIRGLTAREPQRIGLSATVGDPGALLQWLAGHCESESSLVQIQGAAADANLQVDYVGSIQNAARVISQLHRGEKRLVFADSRSKVEDLAVALRSLGVDVFVSHAALSADTRQQAEQAFAERQNCVIVATSTLELGLDVGDLDRVIQIDAPGTVASFLQRMGRTGRRAGSVRNMLFLATTDNGLLEALAIVGLFQEGYVEPISPPRAPYHILLQQLFASMFESRMMLTPSDVARTLSRVPEFHGCIEAGWPALLQHLFGAGYLEQTADGVLLGAKAEKRFKGRRFADLCVSFESPRAFSVMHGTQHLGNVDPMTISSGKDEPPVIALGGQSWIIRSIIWDKQLVYVEKAERAGKGRWIGQARGLNARLAQKVKVILADGPEGFEDKLTQRAVNQLDVLREELDYTLDIAPIHIDGRGWEVWSFQGLSQNLLTAARITAAGGDCRSVDSYSIRFSVPGDTLDALGGWQQLESLDAQAPEDAMEQMKFADLLPLSLRQEIWLSRLSQ